MAKDADGRISWVQHSRAAAPYESWLGYVFKKSRLEIRQDTGQVVQVHEGQWVHWKRPVHEELRDSQRICVGSELAAEVYV